MRIVYLSDLIGLATAALILLSTVSSSAQPVSVEALYRQALREKDAGNLKSACAKLEEVVRIRTEAGVKPLKGLGAQFELASCYEAQGKLASAQAQYSRVRELAKREGQQERAKKAGARADALAPRLAYLVLKTPPGVAAIPGLAVRLDGAVLTTLDAPVPCDTGAHVLSVSAPDGQPRETQVLVKVDGDRVEVELKDPRDGHPGTPSTVARDGPSAPGVNPPFATWHSTTGYIAIAAGSAALVAGAVLGIAAIQKNDDSNRGGHCDGDHHCDATGTAVRMEALTLANASTGTIIGGATAVAGGLFLRFALPRITADSSKIEASASVPWMAAGCILKIHGRW